MPFATDKFVTTDVVHVQVTDGDGHVLVTAVGTASEWGLIMDKVTVEEQEETPLQKKLGVPLAVPPFHPNPPWDTTSMSSGVIRVTLEFTSMFYSVRLHAGVMAGRTAIT